jgi:glycosyltransferase involved in cell wall biosynthesis
MLDTLNIGGLEKTLIEIVTNLKGYEQEVWCLKNKGVLSYQIEGKGISVREFNFGSGITFSSLILLSKALKKEHIDIVHCHGIFPSIWGISAAILARLPIKIAHCQNEYYDIERKDIIKFRFLGHFTTKMIAVSEAVKKCLVTFIGINSEKIAVIYNSAVTIRPQDASMRGLFRKSVGLNKDDFVIGSISRLEEHKGQHFLVEAIAECKAHEVECKCIIAGDGPAKEGLALKIKSLGLDDAVILLGWRSDIQELLLAMDVFVYPSTLREGLPLALAEAASAGVALIATGIGGNPEIVKDGVNGFIVPPKDARALAEKIRYFFSNPAEIKRMGENSKKIWEDAFSSETMIDKIDALYKSVTMVKRRGTKAVSGGG